MYKSILALLFTLGLCHTVSAAKVPYISHLSLDSAVKELRKAGLVPKIRWHSKSCAYWTDGWVYSASPRDGTEIKHRSVVSIIAKSQRSCSGQLATSIP